MCTRDLLLLIIIRIIGDDNGVGDDGGDGDGVVDDGGGAPDNDGQSATAYIGTVI